MIITFSATNHTSCTPPYDEQSKGYSIYAAFLAFIIPFTVLIVFYVAIAVMMRAKTKTKIKRIKKKVESIAWASTVDTHHLTVPHTHPSRLTSTTITDVGDDTVSYDYSSNVQSSSEAVQNNGVYLGQGKEISKIVKKQLKKEEAFQRR